jgi:hypothetical protein
MQSSFAARVSQLISVVRASADIESDTTCNPIKRLVLHPFLLLMKKSQYLPVAKLKQRSRRGGRWDEPRSCYVVLANGLGP